MGSAEKYELPFKASHGDLRTLCTVGAGADGTTAQQPRPATQLIFRQWGMEELQIWEDF
jgi:hypothetical protein